MNAESCEGLCGSLTKAYVAQAWSLRRVKNVLNGVGYVVPCKIVNAEVPKRRSVRAGMNGLL